jgi:hypothetical protein
VTLTLENFQVVNASGLPDASVLAADGVREVAQRLSMWIDQARAAANRSSLFDRGAYAAPDNIFKQMEIARNAVENDDVVGGVAEVTEGLAFQEVIYESENADDADVLNQWGEDVALDQLVRKCWREEFTYSQFVAATWWGMRQYKVRGYGPPVPPPMDKTIDPATGVVSWTEPRDEETGRPIKPKRGARRKKSYNLWVPVGITILDSLKVVPVGSTAWGQEQLAWRASKDEMSTWDALDDGTIVDPMMSALMVGKYEPGPVEKAQLSKLGVDTSRLLLLNPQLVFRHTITRPDYERWAAIRMKSVFRLLDLKQQQMEMDRVHLIGAANYILLVKKGSKEEPALQPEIENLNENFKVMAKLPVIVSDHRLDIEIITPKTDLTLQRDRYDLIDNRIMNRLLGTMQVGGKSGGRSETTLTIGRAVARVMENRRQMIGQTLKRRLTKAIIDHPRNAGQFDDGAIPEMVFRPRNVALDIDAVIMQAIQAAKQAGDISRASWLEELGFDEAVEAQRREFEDEQFGDIFKPPAVPFSSPLLHNALPPGGGPGQPGQGSGPNDANGGGRPVGGGNAPKNPSKTARAKTPAGNPKTGSS